MSFDVTVVHQESGRYDYDGNYTSNMGAFFAWALQGADISDPTSRCDSRDALFGARPRDGLAMLNGMTAEAVAMKLRKALERIESADQEWLQRFNAPNGWGRVDRATSFLREVLAACADNPGDVVYVSM